MRLAQERVLLIAPAMKRLNPLVFGRRGALMRELGRGVRFRCGHRGSGVNFQRSPVLMPGVGSAPGVRRVHDLAGQRLRGLQRQRLNQLPSQRRNDLAGERRHDLAGQRRRRLPRERRNDLAGQRRNNLPGQRLHDLARQRSHDLHRLLVSGTIDGRLIIAGPRRSQNGTRQNQNA